MAAQKGSSLLIKIGDGASPEVFTALAGLRTKTLTINAEQVDVTNSDSVNKWRELLAGAGIKSMSASGAGVFTDQTVDGTVRTEMFAQVIKNYQIVVPGFGTFEGLFQMTQLQYAGEHNAEVTWDISLESAGEIAFEAAV
jgi:TP901-1 family phage major tail protein